MNKLTNWLLNPPVNGPRAILLIRLMAGAVFFWEGVMKFVFPNQGVGRFTKLGFPAPHFTATADGWFEIVGGLLLLTGYRARLTSLVMAAFCVATAVFFHRHFADQNQMIHFLKNVMMAGGLLQITYFGAGAFSLDRRSDSSLASLSAS